MDAEACVSCGRPLKSQAAFCSSCGHRRGEPPVDRKAQIQARAAKVRRIESGWDAIRSVIFLYLSLLAGIGLTFLISKASDEFTAEAAGEIIIVAIVTVASLIHRQELKDCTRNAGFAWKGYGAILLASVGVALVVHSYVWGLHHLFRLKTTSELSAFEGRSPAWAFLLYAGAPAVFEELGFRGVLFGLLRRSLNAREAVLLSAVLFGIVHLSVPILITHVPLGLYLGWLRERSGSIYPSMTAHFLHNSLIVAGTTWSLLPGT